MNSSKIPPTSPIKPGTDGEKEKRMKKYKTLIIVAIIIILLCVSVSLFIQRNTKQEAENINTVKYFETPDRIVYKTKGRDEYYVFTSAKNDYDQLLSQLIKCIDGVGEGTRLSQEDMKKIEQEENYIELDYDTISKNYVIAYQKENYNVIKRTDEGGIVVKNKIGQKEQLEKMLKEQTRGKEAYHMSDTKEYKMPETFSYQVPSWSNELKKYEQGIYSVRLGTKDAYQKFIMNNKLTVTQDIQEEQFEKTNVIATITKYPIEKIETRVGGVTLHFTGAENAEKYYINFYCLSKAININCIYREYGQVTMTSKESPEIEVVEIPKVVTNGNAITEETAKQIAISALKKDGISTYTDMQIERKVENKYYLEKWTDSNQNYAEKYTPTNEYEAVDTWCIAFQDAGDVGCYVMVWVDALTGEVLCYHWTGE